MLPTSFHVQAEYPRSCITTEDGMSKQHIVENCTSQHSVHILDVSASCGLLVPDLISGLRRHGNNLL